VDITFYRHQSKQGVPHGPLKGRTENAPANMFLSLDMLIEKISLLACSIATQSHTNSEPILNKVSSKINSSTLFFLEDSFFGLYFCIQFQMEAGFRLIKHDDSLSEAPLQESPEK
jgi:hypothetical protein